jgi:hypothetical protein
MPAKPADSWTTRIWREFRAGNLTRSFRDALLTLATFRGTGGLCIPSHATLADRAKVGERTVLRALHQARELGLVAWSERRVRRGWRWLRSSNAYRLILPAGDVQPGLRPRAASCRHFGAGGESQENQGAREAMANLLRMAGSTEQARRALAARAAAGTARLAAEWAARHAPARA